MITCCLLYYRLTILMLSATESFVFTKCRHDSLVNVAICDLIRAKIMDQLITKPNLCRINVSASEN